MNKQVIPFQFENYPVRTVVIENEPWFIAKDVGDALGIQKVRNTIALFPDSERDAHTMGTPNGVQTFIIVNEPGLYRLIFQSRKPEAEKFKTWVFEEVLPQIRRTGAYVPASAELTLNKTEVVAINTLLMKAEKRLLYLEHENDLLRTQKRLHEKINRLEEQLSKKNTPLSKHEREQILGLKDSFSATQIARMLNRSASAVNRVIKEGKV